MAKGNISSLVYTESPLVITKEKFCELLQEQIRKGETLLEIDVPIIQSSVSYHGGFASVRGAAENVVYDERAENVFVSDYNRWKDRNKTIYRTSFESSESIYYHEYESQIWRIWGTDTIKEYKDNIKRQVNHLQGDIERADLIKCVASIDNDKRLKEYQEKVKTPMVFISHSSEDKIFAEALVVMLEDIGFDSSNLFCSSVDGYGVGLSEDIFETLRGLFQKHNLYVIFIHSPRYYTSPVSLNEMGAAWVLRTDFCSFLTTDMDFSMMKGVVNGNAISIKVDAEDTPARLTELKDKLTQLFHLSKMDAVKWERKRNAFIKAVNAIDYVSDNTAISPSPIDDEYKRLQVEKLKREEMERKQAKVRGNIIEGRSKGSRILKVFNSGQSKARKVSVEWLNPDDSVIVQQKFGLLGEISPQSSRSYNMVLCEGHIPTMRLRYTWSDDNDENNTYEEDVQI